MATLEREDRYVRLSELARYSSLSVRTLERLIDDPVHPLPAHRVKGRRVVKLSDYDAWLTEHEQLASRRVVSGKGLTRHERAVWALRGFAIED